MADYARGVGDFNRRLSPAADLCGLRHKTVELDAE
jgi:hypothetical protein